MENRIRTDSTAVSAEELILDNIELTAKLILAEEQLKALGTDAGIHEGSLDHILSDEELYSKVSSAYEYGNERCTDANVRAMSDKIRILNEKYNEKSKAHVEACRKYRESLIRYDKLKEQLAAQNSVAAGQLRGLRKAAYTYSLYGFRGFISRLIEKIKGKGV